MNIIDKYRAWRTRKEVRKQFSLIRNNITRRLESGKQTKERWEEQFLWYDTVIKRHFTRDKNIMQSLKLIRDINPDASMAIWNFLRLANQGHELECLTTDDNEDEEGRSMLNALAKRVGKLYGDGGGKDQLVNVLLLTAFTQGAIAMEVELDEGLKDVVDYHPIDPSTLDFRRDKDTGEVQLGQRQKDGKFKVLNREQVFYYPIDPDIGDPYGRSPILPVLQIVFFQVEVLRDLKAVVHHQGHARFDIKIVEEAIMKNIPKSIEAKGQDAVIKFVKDYVNSIEKMFNELKPDDNFIHTDSVSVDMVGGTQGRSMDVTKVIDVINQQVVTSLKQLPILLGRNEGTTETHGSIQWQIYVAGIKSIQRAVKRVFERADNLALQIWGRQSRVRITFHSVREVDRLHEAQAEAVETRTKIAQVNQGWIDNDEAANDIVGHNAVGEPQQQQQSSNLLGSFRQQRSRQAKQTKRINKARSDTEDEFIKEVDMPWASDIARLTVDVANFTHDAFQEQQSLYIQRLQEASNIPTRALIGVNRTTRDDNGVPDPTEEFKKWVEDQILKDSIQWVEYFEENGLEYFAEAADIAGRSSIENLGMDIDVDFNVRNSNFLQHLAERASSYGKIQTTTDEAVIWELWDAAFNGEGIAQMVERIQDMPYFNVERAYVTARTEVLTAARAGNQEGWRQSGVVIGKEWAVTVDGRERDAHREAGGQRKTLDEPYVVDGELLMYPGDTLNGASLKNIIQCRCAEIPIVEGEEI